MGTTCSVSEIDVQLHELLDRVDVTQMEQRSKCRQFPHQSMGISEKEASFPSNSKSAEASVDSPLPTKTMSVRDLGGSSGELLIFLERATNVPYHDTLRDLTCQTMNSKSHGEPSVRAWVEDSAGKIVGKVAVWPPKHANGTPSWYTAYSLGCQLNRPDAVSLKFELLDNGTVLGSLSVPYHDLPGHSVIEKELDVRQKNPADPASTIIFQVVDSNEVTSKRTVYFVRHGESSWNKAQSKLDLYEMGRQTDHPLSTKGRDQAEALSSKISEESEASILKPDVIYVSPLTRAIQTAIIGLGTVLNQPGREELVLMANAREKQNFGGFDSKPQQIGSNVVQRSLNEMVNLYEGQEKQKSVVNGLKNLKFDTQEVQDRWWNNVAAESDVQVKARLEEFMAQLKYSPHHTIVVVGHSHFFRAVFKQFLSDEFRKSNEELANGLSKKKLNNCGVARLDLDPAVNEGGPIMDVKLIFDTFLESDGGLCKCQAEPAPQKHEITLTTP